MNRRDFLSSTAALSAVVPFLHGSAETPDSTHNCDYLVESKVSMGRGIVTIDNLGTFVCSFPDSSKVSASTVLAADLKAAFALRYWLDGNTLTSSQNYPRWVRFTDCDVTDENAKMLITTYKPIYRIIAAKTKRPQVFYNMLFSYEHSMPVERVCREQTPLDKLWLKRLWGYWDRFWREQPPLLCGELGPPQGSVDFRWGVRC